MPVRPAAQPRGPARDARRRGRSSAQPAPRARRPGAAGSCGRHCRATRSRPRAAGDADAARPASPAHARSAGMDGSCGRRRAGRRAGRARRRRCTRRRHRGRRCRTPTARRPHERSWRSRHRVPRRPRCAACRRWWGTRFPTTARHPPRPRPGPRATSRHACRAPRARPRRRRVPGAGVRSRRCSPAPSAANAVTVGPRPATAGFQGRRTPPGCRNAARSLVDRPHAARDGLPTP